MEDNFEQNDFEEFLQDQVKNHRMYPADAVWREIDKKLHGEKRWPALTIAALSLLSVTVLICIYFTPKPNIFAVQPSNINTVALQPAQKNNILNNIISSSPFGQEKHYAISTQKPASEQSSTSSTVNPNTKLSDLKVSSNTSSSGLILNRRKGQNNYVISQFATLENNTRNEKVVSVSNTFSQSNKELIENATEILNSTKPIIDKKGKATVDISSTKDYSDKNIVDEFLKEHIDDVKQTIFKTGLKNKFSYQIYTAPSISYRKLLEDNTIEKLSNNSGPVGLNYVTDVNKVVRHKPGTGIEIGVSFLYNLSDKVRVKSGFQFNMRQYSIEAYRSNTEVASIALIGSNRIDTVNTYSIYRNNNGYSSAELVNRYYQISMPVGIEWEVIGNKKIQLNVAGTIQPTYLLNRNAFMLSTNFKNYTESPGMVRQWNLNSNIEAFISYKVGDFKWQLGPQLRYQPYSTFIPEYPIKEHLMDYGIKLGFSKIIK